MRKKRIMAGCAAIFLLAAVTAGAETYFSASARERYQNLNTKRLGIALEEDAWTAEKLAEQDGKGNAADGTAQTKMDLSDGQLVLDQIVPGETIQAPVYVTNTENTTLYARVIVRKGWESSGAQQETEADPAAITVVPGDTGWLVQEQENGTVVLYYTKPLEPGERTEPILEAVQFARSLGNECADQSAVLSFQADAVQAFSAEAAMEFQWGVRPVLDEAGVITEVQTE